MNINHIAVWVKDLEKMKQFYVRYFKTIPNNKYLYKNIGFESYFLIFDSATRIEIMKRDGISETMNDSNKQFTGNIHVVFSVGSTDKVDLLTNELMFDGCDILDGPETTGDGYYESVVLDPENNRIEITV